jgi:hypothetical protein
MGYNRPWIGFKGKSAGNLPEAMVLGGKYRAFRKCSLQEMGLK